MEQRKEIEKVPAQITREGLFAYFDQMTDEDGRISTTADWLADVGMLIAHVTANKAEGLEKAAEMADKIRVLSEQSSCNDLAYWNPRYGKWTPCLTFTELRNIFGVVVSAE